MQEAPPPLPFTPRGADAHPLVVTPRSFAAQQQQPATQEPPSIQIMVPSLSNRSIDLYVSTALDIFDLLDFLDSLDSLDSLNSLDFLDFRDFLDASIPSRFNQPIVSCIYVSHLYLTPR